VEPRGPGAVDGREVRASEAITVVLILGAFVFRAPLLVPVVAVIDGLGAVVGVHAHPVHALYRATVARWLQAGHDLEAPSAVRALQTLTAASCALASLALAAAAVAAVDATTGFNVAVALRDRFLHS